MIGVFEGVYAWLVEHALVLGAVAALVAIGAAILAVVKWGVPFFSKKPPAPIHSPETPPAGAKLTIAEFIEIRRQMRANLLEELKIADPSEAVILRARVDELERQIADPDPALAAALEENARLKARLTREGNLIGADRLRAASAAVDRLDYRLADDIFAEIEERQKIEVQIAARAAFGRGEIAEAEVRWHDAATHYARAASLDSKAETLRKAAHFAQLAGEYARAERLAADYLALARAGDDPKTLSLALDGCASVAWLLGRHEEAEGMFCEALAIVHALLGEGHPDYGARLNNLGNVVQAQGRHAEAERLFRQGLEIGRATLGERHPDYATRLNNLGNVVQAQGRHTEAEELFRQALEIGRATIGERHPDYAIRLNNLGSVVLAQGRHAEAEELFREALEIGRATMGEKHPDYAIRLNNLGSVVRSQGRLAEAEGLYRKSLEIGRATIGAGHPDYARCLLNLGAVLAEMKRFDEASEMLNDSLTILRATLPPDHPNIAQVEQSLANLP